MCSLWKITTVLATLFALGGGPVLADCYHNGKKMPEGTRIGVLVCEDGQWVEKR